MGRVIFALIPLAIAAGGANAQSLQNIENCRQLVNGADRLACYDALQTNASAKPDSTSASASPVRLASARFTIQNENYEQKIFRPRVELRLSFANSSAKAVAALALEISIKDAFGDIILSDDTKLDINLRPGGTGTSPTFFIWEHNQFMNDDPYSKLMGPVAAGTAKADVAVKKVVYQDGSVESY